jgi:aldose 1-epimerase
MSLSGVELEIFSGTQRAVVATVGGTLRGYEVDDRAVVDGFGVDEVCPGGRGQILMPWPNRIADGRWEHEGRRQQLPIDEPDLGHAIHGLVRWGEWRIVHQGPGVAVLRHRLCARPGYPFWLDVGVEYRLSPSGLAVAFSATNIGATPCPFGAGAHPYFVFPQKDVNAVELTVAADDWLEVDARSIPRAWRPVAGNKVDFRRPRVIGGALLDQAYTHLDRDGDGLAEVRLRDGDHTIRIWQDRAFGYVQVFTGDTLADRPRRRQALAVEPMSCAPNAFNSGDGLRTLAPGESFLGRWGVTAT